MRFRFVGLVVSMGFMAGVAVAQNPPPRTQAIQPRPTAQAVPAQPGQPARLAQPGAIAQPGQQGQFTQGQSGSPDQQIAACVYGACNNEIEICKFAESKCTNDECREFCQRMVRDHTPGCQEMQRLAGNLANHGQGQSGRAAAGGGHLDWVAIHNQIGEQCLASVKKELGQKQGAQFDECFMGQQIGEHLKVIDELKVLRNYATGDLQQKLDNELQTAEQHLQLAKQLEHKLKENPSERVSRRPDSNK